MKRKLLRNRILSLVFLVSSLLIPISFAYWNVTGGATSDIFVHIPIGKWTTTPTSNVPTGALTLAEYATVPDGHTKGKVIYLEDLNLLVLVDADWGIPANRILSSKMNDQFVFGMTWVVNGYQNNHEYIYGQVVIHNGHYFQVKNSWNGSAWPADEPGHSSAWTQITIPTYNSSVAYVKNDVVSYNGGIYQIKTDAQVSNANSYAPGVTINSWQRLDNFYSATNTYNTRDIIIYNNRIYRALQNNINASPADLANTSKWLRYD